MADVASEGRPANGAASSGSLSPARTGPFTQGDEEPYIIALYEANGLASVAAQALGYRSASQVNTYAKHNPEFALRLAEHQHISKSVFKDRLISVWHDALLNGITREERDAQGRVWRSTRISADLKALGWAIERLFPGEYHLPSVHQHVGDNGGPIRFSFPMGEADVVDEEPEAEDADWQDSSALESRQL